LYKKLKDYEGNATGLFTGLISRKKKNKNDLLLQDISPDLIGFFLKRLSYKVEDMLNFGNGTTYKVLGDCVGDFKESRKYLLCECNICSHKRNVQIVDLRSKKVNCEICFIERLSTEASNQNLELLGDSTDGDKKRRSYKFIDCGHIRDIATGDVRLGNFSCTECSQLKFLDACKKNNITYVSSAIPDGRKNSGEFRYIRFNACGHEKNINRISLISGGVPHCNICEQTALVAYSKSIGLTFVKYVGNTRRSFIIDRCGHEKTLGLSNLKLGSVHCEICAVEKFREEAIVSGLEYIAPSEEKEYKLYKAPCGCINKLRLCHVRIGHWTCRTCEKGFREYPNNIYLYKLKYEDFEWLKLGHGKNPEKRKYAYALAEGVDINLVMQIEVATGKFAEDHEKRLHRKYKKQNIDKVFMKQFMTESGFTETYPIEMLNTLVKEIEHIKELNGN